MSALSWCLYGRRCLIPIIAIGAVLVAIGGRPAMTSAHPLDQYLQISYITVGEHTVEVEIDLTPGVLLAPEVLAAIDGDGDSSISTAEAQSYAAKIVEDLELSVDGARLEPSLASVDMPAYLNIQAGYGLIKVFASAELPGSAAGTYSLTYANGFAPTGSTYQVNSFVADGASVQLGTQDRSDTQQSMVMDFTLGGGASEGTEVNLDSSETTNGGTARLARYLTDPAPSPVTLAVALGLAILLGGLHALTPGHGKTLVAAYLVGNRGTVRHAISLGAIVTFTHTSSVVAIGLLALFASHYIVPQVLVPVLEIISGGLVVYLGGRL